MVKTLEQRIAQHQKLVQALHKLSREVVNMIIEEEFYIAELCEEQAKEKKDD